jgi:hypothetical protein
MYKNVYVLLYQHHKLLELNQNVDIEIPVTVIDWFMTKEVVTYSELEFTYFSNTFICEFEFHIFGFSVQIIYIVTCYLKAGVLKAEDTAIVRQRLR